MHNIEPYYNWRHIYVSEEDKNSPFYKRVYSEFEYSKTVYNYYIHPQWDNFGSETLYLKILMVDYSEKYSIIELIGEWNDALENDIMELIQNVFEPLMNHGIHKFILIGENVLNFHSSGKDYYEEFSTNLFERSGWVICLNMPAQTSNEFKKEQLHRFIRLFDLSDWRAYTPFHLFSKFNKELARGVLE